MAQLEVQMTGNNPVAKLVYNSNPGDGKFHPKYNLLGTVNIQNGEVSPPDLIDLCAGYTLTAAARNILAKAIPPAR